MAILAQYNILRFFTDKLARTWDKNPDSRCSELVFFETGQLPFVTLAVDTAPTGQYPSDVEIELYDSNDVKISTTGQINMTVTAKTGYYQLTYMGSAPMPNHTEKYLYLKITNLSEVYYSDIFGWVDDVTDLLKFNIASADISAGDYVLSMDALVHRFYLSAEYHGIKPKINQIGIDNNGVTDILFGTRVLPREFEIDANESIFIYLSALGLVKGNGLVEITWGYETFTATDILVEEIQNHYEEIYQVKLTFVCENESVSMNNTIA